jgi:hypothetical protein
MTDRSLERYANDVLAALVIGSFVAFVAASTLGDVALGFSGLRRSVFVNGVLLVVLIPTAWVFGAQTLVAVSTLAKAAFVPEQLTASGPAEQEPADASTADRDDDSRPRTDPSGGSHGDPTADGGTGDLTDEPGGSTPPVDDEFRDPVAGHPVADTSDTPRQRMIQSEWPPLDVLLSFVVLTPLVVVLLAPFASVLATAVPPVRLPVVDATVPRVGVVGALVVVLFAAVVGWRRTDRPSVAWLVLGSFVAATAAASAIGVRQAPDESAARLELAVDGLDAMPDQFFLLYFVLVLVVVVWAFGERAANAVALIRNRSSQQ